MIEETEPTEAKPEVKQTSTKNAIQTMLRALQLALKATNYKPKTASQKMSILYDQGRKSVDNPTLADYIEKAEKTVLRKYEKEIIGEAGELIKAELKLIKSELDAVRELLK